jgi:hypothetical protein
VAVLGYFAVSHGYFLSQAGAAPASSASSDALRFAGSGCPSGAELRALDPAFSDPSQPGLFEFTFNRFELAGAASAEAANSSCTVQLGYSVPAGTSIRLVGGEWSGEATLGSPGAVKVRREYRLSGASPLAREIDLDPDFKGTFFFRDDMREALPNPDAGWTPCSAQTSEALAQATISASASGSGTSAKIFFGRAFQIEERPCPTS